MNGKTRMNQQTHVGKNYGGVDTYKLSRVFAT